MIQLTANIELQKDYKIKENIEKNQKGVYFDQESERINNEIKLLGDINEE